jgi:HD-like signal output (HDOD) protein
MNSATSEILSKKVSELGNLPAMPSVLNSLTEHFSQDPSRINIHKVVELISYDKSLAAQCLRMANSALFHRYSEIQSVNDAVLALGLGRVRDIVYSCSLPQLFVGSKQGMAPATFWRHALGVALVSQHLGQRLAVACQDKLYLTGLLHDIGILVNALLFPREFAGILLTAETTEVPLCEAEQQVLGFSHCESGRILADLWKLPASISTVVEFHHTPPTEGDDVELAAIIYLADLLCRLRGLGYGYYEAREFELGSEPAWRTLAARYPVAAQLDMARFTFELDAYCVEVHAMVDAILAGRPK